MLYPTLVSHMRSVAFGFPTGLRYIWFPNTHSKWNVNISSRVADLTWTFCFTGWQVPRPEGSVPTQCETKHIKTTQWKTWGYSYHVSLIDSCQKDFEAYTSVFVLVPCFVMFLSRDTILNSKFLDYCVWVWNEMRLFYGFLVGFLLILHFQIPHLENRKLHRSFHVTLNFSKGTVTATCSFLMKHRAICSPYSMSYLLMINC